MELRHIRYFVMAAEEQNFGRAAERLNVSQPALSQQMRNLEEDLGVKLFERLSRGVVLSSAGETFLEGVGPILRDIQELCARTRRAGLGQVGHLKVAMNEFATQHTEVAMAFNSFRRTFPEVDLDIVPLTSKKQLEYLLDSKLNAGFLYHCQANSETITLEQAAVPSAASITRVVREMS